MIRLQNPTDEILHLTPQCSNNSSYRLDIPLHEEVNNDIANKREYPINNIKIEILVTYLNLSLLWMLNLPLKYRWNLYRLCLVYVIKQQLSILRVLR